MPTPTGIWSQKEADLHHAFDYPLARWIGQFLSKYEPVVDFGCGKGEYIEYLSDIGFESVHGVEGTQLDGFRVQSIAVHDLTKPLPKKYTGFNVISLEVGEHIPEEFLDVYLDNITAPLDAGNRLILSWAVPGQEGIGHISCRTNEWVIDQMRKRGVHQLHVQTQKARENTSNHCAYFRDTLLIFTK